MVILPIFSGILLPDLTKLKIPQLLRIAFPHIPPTLAPPLPPHLPVLSLLFPLFDVSPTLVRLLVLYYFLFFHLF